MTEAGHHDEAHRHQHEIGPALRGEVQPEPVGDADTPVRGHQRVE